MSDRGGPLVYVMGPSGAGKDAVLGRARELLPAGCPVVFAHRYITRPATGAGENHVELSAPEFRMRRDCGLFAFAWSAHGNDYGIGCEIHAWRRSGLVVVISGSRAHYAALAERAPTVWPVLITASRERLAERIGRRGRESGPAAAARLARADDYEIADSRLVTIANDGPLDEAAEALVRILTRLACSAAGLRPGRSAPAS